MRLVYVALGWFKTLFTIILFTICTLVISQVSFAQGFDASGLQGAAPTNPTSLQFGPDGRLYVSQQNGTLYAYTIERTVGSDGKGVYSVVDTETINIVKVIQNHDDDGDINTTQIRQITGLHATGTAENPVLYVSSSDWRIGGGDGGGDANLDTNSGILSKVSWVGNGISDPNGFWDRIDLIRGLPRCEENHSTNGMQIDSNSNIMYLASGGNTNAGAPSNNFAFSTEYALSAAILSVDLNALEQMPVRTDPRSGAKYVFDLPTVDDPTRQNIDNTHPDFPYDASHPQYNETIDLGDPFGGNDGLNQAKLLPGSPVQIFSPGWRNAYDVLLTENGNMYTWDNGANTGWGGLPNNEGTNNVNNNWIAGEPGATGSNPLNGKSVDNKDGLHKISLGYYGGHPTPIRANPNDAGLYTHDHGSGGNNGTIGGYFRTTVDETNPNISLPVDWPPVDPSLANPIEGTFVYPEDGPGHLYSITAKSINGLAEYTASNFNGAMKGDLLAANFKDQTIIRVKFNSDGTAAEQVFTTFASGLGNQPLDVTAQGDNDIFPGTVWIAEYGAKGIEVLEPQDVFVCDVDVNNTDYDPQADSDNDGYTDGDEILNGTNPCSGSSKPNDYDSDNISDLSDPDDDNDGIDDLVDVFQLDPDNGLTTSLPLEFKFALGQNKIGFFTLGLTGLMTNGTTDYLNMFDGSNILPGGATEKFGIKEVSEGDALSNLNNQDNAFQFGVNVSQSTEPFSVKLTTPSPYLGYPTPALDDMSFGVYIGNGDQDNYLKLVINANGGSGGFSVLYESDGILINQGQFLGNGVLDANNVTSTNLILSVNPQDGTVQPKYEFNNGTTQNLGNPIQLQGDLLNVVQSSSKALAIGIISTARGSGTTFNADYGLIDISFDSDNAGGDEPSTYINVGGGQVISSSGETWQADNYFTGGNTFSNTSQVISGTGLQGVYQTERYGQFSYEIPVSSPGKYFVELHFAEIFNQITAPGQRLFNVNIENGQATLNEFDVFAEAGFATALVKTFNNISVSDGFLSVSVTNGSVENAKLSGIALGTDVDATTDALTVDLSSYHFQNQEVGTTSSPQGFVLTNNSAQDISISTSNLIGDNTGDFVVNGLGSSDIVPANSNVSFTASFAPQEGSSTVRTAQLEILHSGENSPLLIDLSGEVFTNEPIVLSLQPISDQVGNEGDMVNLTLVASGGSGSYTYGATGLPGGITIDATTGAISGSLADGSSNNSPYSVVVTVDDGIDVVTTTFDWTVQAPSTGGGGEVVARINAGETTAGDEYLGTDGRLWDIDGLFTGGNIYPQTPSGAAISGTDDDFLYQTERSGASGFGYSIPVPSPGLYTVELHFAELWWTVGTGSGGPGSRIFDIVMEGQTYLEDFDILSEVPGATALVKTFEVEVTDGSLDIEGIPVVDQAKISAIQVEASDGGGVTAPLSLQPISDQVGNEGDIVSLTVVASGGSGSYTYSATGLPAGVSLDATTGAMTGTISEGASVGSPYSVEITVGDGTDIATITFGWTVQAPSDGGEIIEFSFSPIHDAYIQNDTGFNNGDLRVEHNKRVTYLQFSVEGVATSSAVSSAVLKLTVGGDNGTGIINAFYSDDNDWTETNLSIANAPAAVNGLSSVSGTFTSPNVYEFDVTSAIEGNGNYTFVLTMDSGGNDVAFSSKEGGSAPELLLEVGGQNASARWAPKALIPIQESKKEGYILQIYPNPTDNILNIEVGDLEEGKPVFIELFNLLGQKIYSETKQGSFNTKLNLKDYISGNRGIFIVKLSIGDSRGNQSFEVQKIVIK